VLFSGNGLLQRLFFWYRPKALSRLFFLANAGFLPGLGEPGIFFGALELILAVSVECYRGLTLFVR